MDSHQPHSRENGPQAHQIELVGALLEKYKGSAMAPVLDHAIADLDRFAGFSSPQFTPLTGEVGSTDDSIDNEGDDTVELGSTFGPSAYTTIQLSPQLSKDELPSKEDFDALDEVDKYNVEAGRYGEFIAVPQGKDMPSDSSEFLGYLLSITEAELVRENKASKLYRCQYLGSEVFVNVSRQNFGEYDVHSARLLGSKLGHQELGDFTDEQLKKISEMGLKGYALRADGVKPETLDGHIENLQEAQRVVSAAQEQVEDPEGMELPVEVSDENMEPSQSGTEQAKIGRIRRLGRAVLRVFK